MKKIISIILSVVLVVGVISGGVFIYKNNKNGSKVVDVYNLSEVRESVMDDGQYSYGSISANYSQELYPNKDKIVKEIYVKSGDSVEIGTPLLKYDTTLLELELSECQNNLEIYKQELEKANKELKELKKTLETASNDTKNVNYAVKTANNIPVTGKGVTDSLVEQIDIVVDNQSAISAPSQTVDLTTKPFAGDGTYDNPYRYLCMNNSIIKSNLLKELANRGLYASFEVYEDNIAIGTLSYSLRLVGLSGEDVSDFDINVTISNKENGKVDIIVKQENLPAKAVLKVNLKDYITNDIKLNDDSLVVKENYYISSEITKGGVYTITKMQENVTIPSDNNDNLPVKDEDDKTDIGDDINDEDFDNSDEIILPNDEVTYTKEELNSKIVEVNTNISELNLNIKEEELTITKKQKEIENYTVTSTVSGIVKTLKDSTTTSDTEPFLVINGAEGYYVTGYISEMALDTISVGQTVDGTSWAETVTPFVATIVEISEYPSENAEGSNGDNNPNVSYYPFIAYIEDTTNLKVGDYVELILSASNDIQETEKLYIPNYFIKNEDNKNYVYVANEANILEKRYVTIGKCYYGYLTEILDGISEEDRVAFPYGKAVKEGAKTNDAEIDSLYN